MGISEDDAETAKKFRESLQAPFPFLGDPQAKVSTAYGVHGEGYAKRVTFIVGKDGKIVHVEHDKLEATDALGACPMKPHAKSTKPKKE